MRCRLAADEFDDDGDDEDDEPDDENDPDDVIQAGILGEQGDMAPGSHRQQLSGSCECRNQAGVRWMEYFVYCRDHPGTGELRDRILEAHWSFMDGYAAGMIARGPT